MCAAAIADLEVRPAFEAALVGRQLDVVNIDTAEQVAGVGRGGECGNGDSDEREQFFHGGSMLSRIFGAGASLPTATPR